MGRSAICCGVVGWRSWWRKMGGGAGPGDARGRISLQGGGPSDRRPSQRHSPCPRAVRAPGAAAHRPARGHCRGPARRRPDARAPAAARQAAPKAWSGSAPPHHADGRDHNHAQGSPARSLLPPLCPGLLSLAAPGWQPHPQGSHAGVRARVRSIRPAGRLRHFSGACGGRLLGGGEAGRRGAGEGRSHYRVAAGDGSRPPHNGVAGVRARSGRAPNAPLPGRDVPPLHPSGPRSSSRP
jgi:hypothetical protein